jgi:hypothetical protein
LPVEAWHDVIDEPTFADAILDRLVHNAYRLALDGPSMRDPKTAKSDTTGPVVEMADATATKPTKAIKKCPPSLTGRPRAALRLTRGGHSAPRTGST